MAHDEWVVLLTLDDVVEAEVTRNFLRDHGVDAKLRGSTGATSALDRFTTGLAVRIVVPAEQFERAEEVLDALTPAEDEIVRDPPSIPDGVSGVPYRGGLPDSPIAPFRKRYRSGPIVLAWVIPGAGHFYARHNRAGLVLCASILSLLIVGALQSVGWMLLAGFLCALCDAVLGVLAVDRFNAGRVPGSNKQTALAAGAVLGSIAAALLLTGSGHARILSTPAQDQQTR